MIPQVLHIGTIPLNSFGLMFALAFIVASLMLTKTFQKRGLSAELAESLIFAAALSGLAGARLWYMVLNRDQIEGPFWSNIVAGAGFTFYGGFVVAALVVMVYAIVKKIEVLWLADSLAPTLALAYAVGRVGCQLSGDGDYGVETNSWFGMSYQTGVIPTPPGINVLPTPILESVIAVAVAILLVRLSESTNWSSSGKIFGLYLLLMSIERFVVEFFRIEPKYAFGLSEAQFISVILSVLGVSIILYSRKRLVGLS